MEVPKKSNTAILLFSRTVEEEVKFKRWTPFKSIAQNRSIANTLINQAKRAAFDSGFALLRSNEFNQSGNSFGERFSNAVELVFQQGFEKVVVIGNDCVTMNSNVIVEAANQLNNHLTVLGPSLNGGLYLVGLTAANYNRDELLSLPWESDQLAKSCIEHLKSSILLLPVAMELNNHKDVLQFLRNRAKGESDLYYLLINSLSSAAFTCSYNSKFKVLKGVFESTSGRGPPIAA